MVVSPLFQATRIWVDPGTKEECQASVCLRWADVRSIEHDADTGLEKWQYKGPISYFTANDKGYHLLGAYTTWLALWQAYTASAQALLLAHN